MGDFSILGTRIKELRNSMKKTQREFANHVGCTAATLSAYENGSKSPSLEIVKNIAEKCHVSIDWLCGLTNKKESTDKIESYADVINALTKLSDSIGISIDEANRIVIYDSAVQLFLKDWRKMLALYKDDTINKKLYELWLQGWISDAAPYKTSNEDDMLEYMQILECQKCLGE